MANLIQRVLVRTDLGMSTGLLAAQVAHLHARPFIVTYRLAPSPGSAQFDHVGDVKAWMATPNLYVHGVPNIEVLNYFATECDNQNVFRYDWHDTVYLDISPTQTKAFESVLIGIAIGPDDSDAIKTIVGDLPLL